MTIEEQIADLCDIVADLARVTSEWQGGSHDGGHYVSAQWRGDLNAVAKRAKRLATTIEQQKKG